MHGLWEGHEVVLPPACQSGRWDGGLGKRGREKEARHLGATCCLVALFAMSVSSLLSRNVIAVSLLRM